MKLDDSFKKNMFPLQETPFEGCTDGTWSHNGTYGLRYFTCQPFKPDKASHNRKLVIIVLIPHYTQPYHLRLVKGSFTICVCVCVCVCVCLCTHARDLLPSLQQGVGFGIYINIEGGQM